MTDSITIREVGPRDGLQNEPYLFPTATKLALIEKLLAAGLQEIEVTSFVSPKWVPQFSDALEVAATVRELKERYATSRFSALVPNARGYESFKKAPLDEGCFFVGTSEIFNQKNVNRSIADHINAFQPVLEEMSGDGVHTLAYLSTVCGCPYEGEVALDQVLRVVEQLKEFKRLSLGDTIGIGKPEQVGALVRAVAEIYPVEQIAWHGHDTEGRALDNAQAAYDEGVRLFDSSIAGLGGCPFAPGAKGNLATESLAAHLTNHQLNLDLLNEAATWITKEKTHANSPR